MNMTDVTIFFRVLRNGQIVPISIHSHSTMAASSCHVQFMLSMVVFFFLHQKSIHYIRCFSSDTDRKKSSYTLFTVCALMSIWVDCHHWYILYLSEWCGRFEIINIPILTSYLCRVLYGVMVMLSFIDDGVIKIDLGHVFVSKWQNID